MDSLQQLFTPTLDDLLNKFQQANAQNSHKVIRRRPVAAEDTQQRKKRNRITFDAVQVDQMEKVFAENQYPDAASRDHLATKIQLDEERVQIWFQNRRAKYRRELRHTYHPYEPPKDVEYPFFKKVVSPESKSDNSGIIAPVLAQSKTSVLKLESRASPDKDHPPMTNKKTSLVVSQEIGDQAIFMKALVDSADESANLNAVQLATSLNLLLPGSQNVDQNVCSELTQTEPENNMAGEEDSFEQIDPEKARLLLWALSSLFNVQNNTKS